MGTHFKLPANTCPLIDTVIDNLQEAVKDASKLLEEIRDANAKLRDAAETWESELEEVEKERDKLDEKLTEANDRIEELEREIQEERAAA